LIILISLDKKSIIWYYVEVNIVEINIILLFEVIIYLEEKEMLAIKGIYDGKTIRPLEPIDIKTPYIVIITFIAPAQKEVEIEDEKKATEDFLKLCGKWKDERSAEEIIEDIHSFRRSS